MARTTAEKLQIKPGTEVLLVGTPEQRALLDEALPHLSGTRVPWVAYPNGNRTDINRDSIWASVEELGWTATVNISLDEVWSTVRIKPLP